MASKTSRLGRTSKRTNPQTGLEKKQIKRSKVTDRREREALLSIENYKQGKTR